MILGLADLGLTPRRRGRVTMNLMDECPVRISLERANYTFTSYKSLNRRFGYNNFQSVTNQRYAPRRCSLQGEAGGSAEQCLEEGGQCTRRCCS